MKSEAIEKRTPAHSKKTSASLLLNVGLLLVGIMISFTGFALQFKFHMGHEGEISLTDQFIHLNYLGWSALHKIAILIFSGFAIFHIYSHWKWYLNVLRKHLISKNKLVSTLSLLFILVAITGYLSWILQLTESSEFHRKIVIEIHDKLTVLFFIYMVLHVVKRFRWFQNHLNGVIFHKQPN